MDLIQRAAARLEKSPGSVAPPAELPAAAPEPSAPLLGGARREPPPAGQPRSRAFTLSPTSLAAHGISLPGSGFSRTVEEFRAVKRYIMMNTLRGKSGGDPEASRIVLVTSAKPGDGKTFAAINLALALAYEKDARVLLMDADAYRQSMLEYLGISAGVGWIDAASAGSSVAGDLVLQSSVPSLQVLPAGRQRPEIPELMSSRHMKRILHELVHQDPERYIVIDALPCLKSTEPSILAGLAGQTIFVVAANKTTRDEIDASLRLLSASPCVSLLLNQAAPLLSEQFRGTEYGYGSQR